MVKLHIADYSENKNKKDILENGRRGELLIEKDDIIQFIKMEGDKNQIRIKGKIIPEEEGSGNQYDNEKEMIISFEDNDTEDYFFEMHRKYFDKQRNRKTVRKRLDTLRLKTILAEREVNKLIGSVAPKTKEKFEEK